MSPDIDIALAAFEKAMDAYESAHQSQQVFPGEEWRALKRVLAVHAKDRDELRVGAEVPGFMGALWRFMAQCDFRRVPSWVNGERIRGTEAEFMRDAVAGAVSSIVIQVVGCLVHSQMRPTAAKIMTTAAELIEKDIAKLQAMKKGDAIRRHGFGLIHGGR